MPLETGNQDNCRLIMRWAKEQKIIPPFRVARVDRNYYIVEKNKKMTVKQRNDIEYKKVKCFAMGFVAVHFYQFLANLVRVWFG